MQRSNLISLLFRPVLAKIMRHGFSTIWKEKPMFIFKQRRPTLLGAAILAYSCSVPAMALEKTSVVDDNLTPQQTGVVNKENPYVVANPDAASLPEHSNVGTTEQNVLGTDWTCAGSFPPPEQDC